MALSPGEKLGPYEIIAKIGAGGMGEVYRARDPRLGRDVAIKVSQEQFSERFEREARAIASLNHPNICTLHDIGPNYLVMELVEGEAPKGPGWTKPCQSPGRSPPRSKRRTAKAWSTATSSPATSRSSPTAPSRSSTSAWRSKPAPHVRAREKIRQRCAWPRLRRA